MVALTPTRLNVLQAILGFAEDEVFTSAQLRFKLPDVTPQVLSNHLSDLIADESAALTREGVGKFKYSDREALISLVEIEYSVHERSRGIQPTFLIPDERAKMINGAVNTGEALMAAGIPLYRHIRTALREAATDTQREIVQLRRNTQFNKIGFKHARHTLAGVPREDIMEDMKKYYPNSWKEQMQAFDKFMGEDNNG